MRKEISLSDFKEFCKERKEIRYEFGWYFGDKFSEGVIDFDTIVVSTRDRTVRISAECGSIKLCSVIKIEMTELPFGDTEARIICQDRNGGRATIHYIFFAP